MPEMTVSEIKKRLWMSLMNYFVLEVKLLLKILQRLLLKSSSKEKASTDLDTRGYPLATHVAPPTSPDRTRSNYVNISISYYINARVKQGLGKS